MTSSRRLLLATPLLEWITKYKEALTVIGGCVAALTAAGWAFFRFRRDEKKQSQREVTATSPAPSISGQTVQIFGIPFAEFDATLRKRESELREELKHNASGRADELTEELTRARDDAKHQREKAEQLAALLNDLRRDLVPPPLDTSTFPSCVRVRNFAPGRQLTITAVTTRRHRIGASIFGAIWCAFLTGIAAGAGIPRVLLPVVFGLIFWWLFTKHYVSFDLQQRRIKIVQPGAFTSGIEPTPLTLSTVFDGTAWTGEVSVRGHIIARCVGLASDTAARNELMNFVRSINWAMGIPILMADWGRALGGDAPTA